MSRFSNLPSPDVYESESRHGSAGEKRLNRVVIFGAFSPPSLAFARTCAQNGIRVYLLERTKDGAKPSAYSSALAGCHAFPTSAERDGYGIDLIKSYCKAVAAEALITVDDADLLWLSEQRHHLEPEVRLLAPSESCLRRLQSKKNQIEFARRAGFEVLPTWYLQNSADIEAIPLENFPVCLRPAVPSEISPIFKALIVHSPESLRAALNGLKRIDGPIIAQPFLKLPDLKVHGGRTETGRILAMQPFLAKRKFEGVTLTLSPASFPPGVEDACRNFANLARITGCFHFDLLFDPTSNKVYYLEINTRMGGLTDKVKALGYDEPAVIIDCFGLGERSWKLLTPTSCRRVTTKRSIIKLMLVVMMGRNMELDYPQVTRLQHLLLSIRDLLTTRDSVFDWHDLKGTAWYYFRLP